MRFFILFFILCSYSCAQKIPSKELNEEEIEVLTAFLNQKYDYKDLFYLNVIVTQLKFNNRFRSNYSRELRYFKIADSVCKNSKDTFSLKLKCPMAYYKKRYVNLLKEKDFKYFNEAYGQNSKEKSIIDIELFLNKSLPMIKEHSKDFYEVYKTDNKKAWTDTSETPSLEIKGIYFSENKEIVLIANSMIESYIGGGQQYSIMKKEDGIWWRFIGSFQLSFV